MPFVGTCALALRWAVPPLESEPRDSTDTDDRDEKETADIGGDVGGRGIWAGSTRPGDPGREYVTLESSKGTNARKGLIFGDGFS